MQYKGLIVIKRMGVQDILIVPLELIEVDDATYNKLLSKDNADIGKVVFRVNFVRGQDGELRANLSVQGGVAS